MTYEVEAIKWLIDDLHLQMCERTIGGLNGSIGDTSKKYAPQYFKKIVLNALIDSDNNNKFDYKEFLSTLTTQIKDAFPKESGFSEKVSPENIKKACMSVFTEQYFAELLYYYKFEAFLCESFFHQNTDISDKIDCNKINFEVDKSVQSVTMSLENDKRMFNVNSIKETFTIDVIDGVLEKDILGDIKNGVNYFIDFLQAQQTQKNETLQKRLQATEENALPRIKHYFTSLNDDSIQPLNKNCFIERAEIFVRDYKHDENYWAKRLDEKMSKVYEYAKERGGANQEFYNSTMALRNAYLATIRDAHEFGKLWADSDKLIEMFGEEMQIYENSLKDGNYAKKTTRRQK